MKELLHHSSGRTEQIDLNPRRDASSRPPLGTINVIFAAPGRTGPSPSRVMSVARLPAKDSNAGLKRAKMDIQSILGFSDEDKVRTIQPHDDALVVTLRIGGYDVKRVLVDQGRVVEIMYLDLYKDLNFRSEDLTTYDSPLVSFEGKTIIPKCQIKLPIQTDLDIVEVDFIVGMINVIFVASGKIGSSLSRVMSVARLPGKDSSVRLKRTKMDIQSILGFSDEDKVRTIQPYDDALVVTLRIGGYDVKRVLVDQGSAVEIMYPDQR